MAIGEFRILFLQVTGIRQQDFTEIRCQAPEQKAGPANPCLIRRAIRRRRQEVTMEQTSIENLAFEPDAEIDGAVCSCLYKLLPTLKPDYADIVWRADILGEPRDRIAVGFGITLNNVSVRIHRGRQALKKRLEEMCLTCPVHGFLDCRCDEAEHIRQQHAAAIS